MKVIEGKQIVFGTYREVGIQIPKSIPTTSCPVMGIADCLVVEAQEHSARPLAPLPLSSLKPQEAGTSSCLQEPHMVNTHTKKPQLLSKDAVIPIHTESIKPDCMQVRSGQREMTLEELFRIGRKEEEQ